MLFSLKNQAIPDGTATPSSKIQHWRHLYCFIGDLGRTDSNRILRFNVGEQIRNRVPPKSMVNLHDIPLGRLGFSDAIPALLSVRSSARLLLHVRIAIERKLSRYRRFNADRRDEVWSKSVEATAEELPRHLLRSLPGQRLLEAIPGHRLLHLYLHLHLVVI